ncbi:MAG: hypothetical protein IT260_23135 [Saprospiraceae bacterium]|nr:hypothetical protein [Saprospiraceae bacterium]
MEQQEKVLNPEESLRVIRESIDLAKNKLRENGFQFLLWGWLVVLASGVDYYLDVVLQHPKHSMAWLLMVVVGMPVSVIYEWRRDKREPGARNIIQDWYGRVWLAFGVSLFLVIALTAPAHQSPVPFILVLVGFATFVSGTMLRFPPLQYGAVAMWAGAGACLALGPQEHLLVQAAATVLGYLIPGYLLNAKVRQRHV